MVGKYLVESVTHTSKALSRGVLMQFDLLDTDEQRKKKQEDFDNQLSFLPVHPLQEKYGQDEPILSRTQYEIMHMVLAGYSIGEIGLKVFIGRHGVKFRLTNVYWKFGVVNRLELIRKASSKGLHFFVKDQESKSLIKHAFHNQINLRAHEKDSNA